MFQDVRHAWRSLWRAPEFTLTVVLTLALGIGVNSLIFTVVNAALLRPLPYPQPDRLVMVWEWRQMNAANFADPKFILANRNWNLSNRELPRYSAANHTFAALAGYISRSVSLTGSGEPERLGAAFVTPDFFGLLGIRPSLGRVFQPDEDRFGNNGFVILSHGLWQRRFGSDPRVLGAKVVIDGEPHTVVGVLPPDTRVVLPAVDESKVALWVPASHQMTAKRKFALYYTLGRLKPGVTIAQAKADLEAIGRQLEEERKRDLVGLNLVPVNDEMSGKVRHALLILLGAVGCVLLVGCANVANLLLARNAARQTDTAVRTALGAGRARLLRHSIAESVLLGLMGGAAGLAAARIAAGALLLWIPEGTVPRLKEAVMDVRVLLFGLAVSMAAALVFGLPAALLAGHRRDEGWLNDTLKSGSAGSGGARRGRYLRRGLVIAEIALAVVLVIGAGLLVRSFLRLRGVDLGFHTEHVSTLSLMLPDQTYREPRQRAAFVQQVLDGLRPVPGVEAVAATNAIPIGRQIITSYSFEIEGRENEKETPSVYYRVVTPDFFRALGIPLRRGRGFTDRDTSNAAIVNEAFVHRFWPDVKPGSMEPLGRRVRTGKEWMEIVGILADLKHDSPDKETQAELYVPFTQNIFGGIDLVLRTRADSANTAALLRGAVRSVDPTFPTGDFRTMEEIVDNAVATPRFYMRLMALFAALAALLAVVGIYGLIAYSVVRRSHEIGVRIAIGASRGAIFRMVIGEALALGLAGVGCGLLAALAATRLLANLLFGIKPADAFTFAAAGLGFVLVAVLASCIPAVRTNRIDPVVTLRSL
jgi:putative ABC transport system permease protein